MNSQAKGEQVGEQERQDNMEDNERESWQLLEHSDCSLEATLETGGVRSRMYWKDIEHIILSSFVNADLQLGHISCCRARAVVADAPVEKYVGYVKLRV